MQVTITARHFSLSSHTSDDIKSKIEPLDRFDDQIRYIDVVCQKEHEQAIMEWKIGYETGKPVVLSTEADTLKTCVDQLLDKAEKTLKKHKAQREARGSEKITELV